MITDKELKQEILDEFYKEREKLLIVRIKTVGGWKYLCQKCKGEPITKEHILEHLKDNHCYFAGEERLIDFTIQKLTEKHLTTIKTFKGELEKRQKGLNVTLSAHIDSQISAISELEQKYKDDTKQTEG